jgi:tryptophan synthase alpha chain
MNKRLSITEVFTTQRAKGQIALMPFIPAGFSDLDATRAVLPALEQAGANIIEIGIPFSDPIADGPTIQEAFNVALTKKITVADIFATIASARPNLSIPLIAMVSFSIVYRYGVEQFLTDAKSAGFDGLIVPDLPPPEAEGICGQIHAAGLDSNLLIAPTTAAERRKEIARLSSGFVYYMSVSGITGERDRLPDGVIENVRQIKTLTRKSVCVGFGISKPAHVKELQGIADGAIVGSAMVKRMREHQNEGAAAIAGAAADYCRELLGQVR